RRGAGTGPGEAKGNLRPLPGDCRRGGAVHLHRGWEPADGGPQPLPQRQALLLHRGDLERGGDLRRRGRGEDGVIRYLLRRVLQPVPLLLGITFISFAVMHLAPGDYLTSMRMNPQIRPETIERLRHNFGLDRPWYLQYLLWLRNAVVGNFGYSFSYKV